MDASSMSTQQVEQLCAQFAKDFRTVTAEIGKVIVGQHEVVAVSYTHLTLPTKRIV